jgi:hypothetical protein
MNFGRSLRLPGNTIRLEDVMRKIIAGMFISIDGVVEAPDQWHFPYFNDEMGEAVGGMLGDADTILIGRVT